MSITETLPVLIRWMIKSDWIDVYRTELASYPDPWSEAQLLPTLREPSTIGMVAECLQPGENYGRAVGHFVYVFHRSRLEVLRMAVYPKFRRQGVGRRMIEKLVSKLSAEKRVRLEVMVRESNLDAQLFLRACGLKAIEVHRERYEDTGEAGYKFEWSALASLRERLEVMR